MFLAVFLFEINNKIVNLQNTFVSRYIIKVFLQITVITFTNIFTLCLRLRQLEILYYKAWIRDIIVNTLCTDLYSFHVVMFLKKHLTSLFSIWEVTTSNSNSQLSHYKYQKINKKFLSDNSIFIF